MIRLLLLNGANIHVNNDEVIKTAIIDNSHYVIELLLNFGAPDIRRIEPKPNKQSCIIS